MKIMYVGPSDAVDCVGRVWKRNEPQDIEPAVAGRAPAKRVAAAMAELQQAIADRDHTRAAELREELVGLDFGEGLLAQDVWAPAPRSKKEDDQ